jgi:hypothetical protein
MALNPGVFTFSSVSRQLLSPISPTPLKATMPRMSSSLLSIDTIALPIQAISRLPILNDRQLLELAYGE